MTIVAVIFTLLQFIGLILAVSALLSTRTSQGTIAWVVTLISFPLLGIPAYLIFGRRRYKRYVSSRAVGEQDARDKLESVKYKIRSYFSPRPEQCEDLRAFEVLAKLPFTEANHVKLLINGEATFDDIFTGIQQAKNYVLIQFYIIKHDSLGQLLSQHIQDALARNVSVYLLYDDIGSYQLDSKYIDTLTEKGAQVHPFHSHRSYKTRFDINFRNHRKVVVVDGEHAWIGGNNVGDEYIQKNPKFPNWRDTHIRISGPAIMGAQHSFIEDWLWVTDQLPELNWTPSIPEVDHYQRAVVLPSGPSDPFETASLMMQHAIHIAKQRIWIASPYFVPDEAVLQALRLAALRGIDVRILIPDKPDHLLVKLSAYALLPGILKAGVKVMRYKKGFLHQKVFLIDSYLSSVGTANMDNRSFRLNFEITALIDDKRFASEVEKMLLNDFSYSSAITIEEIKAKPLWFVILCRAAYLSAPVQ